MHNLYNKDEITTLKGHIVKYYANNWYKPIFGLTTTTSAIGFVLYFMNCNDGYNFLLISLLSLFMIRMFTIFHDLNHNSYFPKNNYNINSIVSHFIDIFAIYSTKKWKNVHNIHHIRHGNLNVIDDTRTVLISSEYEKLSSIQKKLYTTFRNPIIFFSVMPLYIFWINKFIEMEIVYLTKYISFFYFLYRVANPQVAISFFISQYLGTIIGTMLFHLQHQVNIGYWKHIETNDSISKMNAELIGSSVIKIPLCLKYFTYGIEYHNIHHFDSKIPSYNLKKCYDEVRQLGYIKTKEIGYVQMVKSLFHVIYNEKTERYESSPFFKMLQLEA